MIKIYPSALEGEPVETHQITESISIAAWLAEKAPAFSMQRESHPISVVVNNRLINPKRWDIELINPHDDVKITVEPKGVTLIVLAVVTIVALGAAYYFWRQAQKGDKDRRAGTEIDSSDISANVVRWGDPIPEIAGSPITYPAILVPQHRWYESPDNENSTEFTEVLLCIGKGEFDVTVDDVAIGGTPVSQLSSAVEIGFFGPDADLSNTSAHEWWHTSEEVGFTTFGGTGLTLGTTSDIATTWQASPNETIRFSRRNSTQITSSSSSVAPTGWERGTRLHDFVIRHDVTFGLNWVSSPLLDAAGVRQGDRVTVDGNLLTVSSIEPATGVVAGVLAKIVGNASPDRLNFGAEPITVIAKLGDVTKEFLLQANLTTYEELVADLNAQMDGIRMEAKHDGSVITLVELSPASGASLTMSGDYKVIFGSAPTITQGVAASAASPKKYLFDDVAFDVGTRMTTADIFPNDYEITEISSNRRTATIRPIGNAGWVGMPANVELPTYLKLSSDSYEVGWSGPFHATPKGETCNAIEVDIFYPQGLIRYNKEGDERWQTAGGVIQYKRVLDFHWNEMPFSRTSKTPNQVADTYRIHVSEGEYMVRVRSNEKPSTDSKVNNKQQWTGLKSRIVHSKTSYEGMTTMAVKIESGDKVSGGVEEKISVRARRRLPTFDDPTKMAATFDIAPFFLYVLESVGYGRDQVDMDALTELNELWVARGERFDLAISQETTLKSVITNILEAGFSELTLKDGLITPVRDQIQTGLPTRYFTPQEFTQPLVQIVESVQPDDVDGVDVEYTEYRTGKQVVEQYRLEGDKGLRVKKVRLQGITGRTMAWRHAARHRRKLAYRRIQYQGATEMQAMNSNYWDFVGLQDGIPVYGQSAFVIEIDQANNRVKVSEKIEPIEGMALATVRKDDGTVTMPLIIEIDETRQWITFDDEMPELKTAKNTDASVLYIGKWHSMAHQALITEVKASADGKVSFNAVGYDERVYADDDGSPWDEKYTSKPYHVDDGIELNQGTLKFNQIIKIKQPSVMEKSEAALMFDEIIKERVVKYSTYEMEAEQNQAALQFDQIIKTRVVSYSTYNMEAERSEASLMFNDIIKTKTARYSTYEMQAEQNQAALKFNEIIKVKV